METTFPVPELSAEEQRILVATYNSPYQRHWGETPQVQALVSAGLLMFAYKLRHEGHKCYMLTARGKAIAKKLATQQQEEFDAKHGA